MYLPIHISYTSEVRYWCGLNAVAVSQTCQTEWKGNSVQSCCRSLVFFHHLMTLFALASMLGRIVRLICFAAFKLITNSNFVGCSTRRLACFVPFRILSTYLAARLR